MDSFEFNKIAGAVLATALGVMALSIVSEIIFAPAEAEQPGYLVAGVEATDDGHGGGGAAPAAEPIEVRLQTADLTAGERATGKCKSCHVFAEGDLRQMPGPNLYGVVGGPVAHLEGYDYSEAFEERHAEGMTWTFDNIDQFLEAPQRFIPGSKMTFAGIKRPNERADIIAYLNTLSSNPLPLPAATAAAPAEAAPADGHAPAPAPAAGDAHAPAPAGETAQPPAAAGPAPLAPAPEVPAVQVPPGEPGTEPATPPPAPPATP